MPGQSRPEELRSMPYELYLKTPEWQERRREALERAENRCQVCYGSDELDVHHRTYERRGCESPSDLTVLCHRCHSLFHGMQHVNSMATPFVLLSDALEGTATELAEHNTKPGSILGVPLGYTELDRLLCGLEPGDLFVLAGRPQARVDLLALNFALNAAAYRHTTFLFSFSHTQEQLTRQLIAIKSAVQLNHIRTGWIDEDEWPPILEASDDLAEIPLVCCTDIGLSPQDIRARLLEYLRRAKEKGEQAEIDFIIIDGITLLEHEGVTYRESSYQQMLQTVRSLKVLAREFHAPLLLTCPLSPQVETRKRSANSASDKTLFFSAQLSDLQPSGIFEQFADVIGFVSPETRVTSENVSAYLVEIEIAQNRNGDKGRMYVYYAARYGAFKDLEPTPKDEDSKV